MKFTGERYIPNGITLDEISIEHLQRYYSIKNLVQGKVVLDAATGEGYGSYILAQDAKIVYGLDISKETIIHAKNRYQKENLKFIEGSIAELPFADNSVDIIVSFETIEHVAEEVQIQFLGEVSRVLKRDGLLIISTPDKHIYSEKPNYQNEFHVKEFYEHEFQIFLNKYFKNVEFFYQKFRITSVLLNTKTEYLKLINIDSVNNNLDGKYLIAVCSNGKFNDIDISNALVDFSDKLGKYIERILSLQKEVEEKNEHIKNLLNQIEKKDAYILNNNQRIEELSIWGKSLDKEIQIKNVIIDEQKIKINNLEDRCSQLEHMLEKKELEKNTEIEELKKYIEEKFYIKNNLADKCKRLENMLQQKERELLEKSNEIEKLLVNKDKILEEIKEMDELNMTISKLEEELEHTKKELNESIELVNNLNAHINQLLEKERILNNIFASDGWKLLTKYYRLRDKILPPKSKRTMFLKLTFNFFKKPKSYIKNISAENIKKFWYYFKTEDINRVNDRIENYMDKYKNNNETATKIKVNKFCDKEKEKIIFPRWEKPLVSIVIPVYNQWEYTYSCLKSIYENTENVTYEVIIADDVSTDETVNIGNYIKNITVIRNEENKGFLLNCNNAAGYARGKYIHFLNNDTNVQKDWLKNLVDLMESDDKIGLVGSKLVYKDGRLQEAGGIIWKDGSGWNYGRLDDPEKPEYNYVKEVDYISGASIMVRKDLWKHLGGFDERFAPAYYEDSDLAFAIRKLGFKAVYQPQSLVVHFEGVSHGTDTSTGIKQYQIENKKKFTAKWQDILNQDHFQNGQVVFKARDKSKEKQTVLVIDHYVPHYDKDAGSKCTYSYLKLFVQMGYKVIFIGDNFYKHEPYTTELQQMGIEVLYGNWYAKNIWKWIQQNGQYINYVYLNRPHISIKYIDKIKQYTKAKIIYFGHDLHYLRELRNYEIEKNEALLKSSNEWKKIEFDLIRKSDVVYVVSAFEQKILIKEFPEKLIRTIPVYIYDEIRNGFNNSYNERQDLLFVGGFGHKPNIDAVIWFVKEIFPAVVKRIPDIKLYIVGSKPPEEIKALASYNIIITGFVSDEKLADLYSRCRVVVVPLRFGAGVKGKVVEALYHQVPIVTTSIGAEGLPGIKDYLAIEDKPLDFAIKVTELYADKNKWDKLSKRSYEYVLDNFSIKAALNIVSRDFKKGEVKNG